MKKIILIILAAAALVALVGGILIGIGAACGGTFNRSKTETVTKMIDKPFSDISITSSSANIIIKVSENGTCYAVCDESELIKYDLTVENGSLSIHENDSRKWHQRIGISFGSGDVTLYLPSGSYGSICLESASGLLECTDPQLSFHDVNLKSASGKIIFTSPAHGTFSAEASSGDITLANAAADTLHVNTASGAISLSRVSSAATAEINTSGGTVTLENCTPHTLAINTAAGKVDLSYVKSVLGMTVNTSSGDISLTSCDSSSIALESASGKICGTLLSDKAFSVTTSSGNVACPPSVSGAGSCTITTSSGDINISIAK